MTFACSFQWLFDEQAQGRRLAVGTVRQHMAAVKALLATAVADGVIRHNPAAGVRISRPGAPTIQQKKPSEIHAVRSTATSWRGF